MPVSIDEDRRRIEASVGDLLPTDEADPFAARTSFARLLAGTRAHGQYARARTDEDPGFQSEVVVRGELVVEGWTLALQGRVDGLRDEGGRTVVEEVKTVILDEERFERLDLDRYPAYVLQLRLYLFLLVHQDDAREVTGRLVFINLPGGAVRTLEVGFDRESVRVLIVARVREIISDWRERRERAVRRRALAVALEFPFPSSRPHQTEMEAECRRAFDAGECLLVTAPPGLGKTAAALTAAVRHALAHDRRVFFVTSKTTQQRIVETTLLRLTAANPGLTAVVLRAKSKICANEVVFCHPDFCEFARDYPSKVGSHGSRERLLDLQLALPDEIYAEGLRSRACPFELSLDLTEQADVVVGDYNYVFDPAVALQRTFAEEGHGDLVLIIDEAHNLIDRARDYYSPSLDSNDLRELLAVVELRPGEIYRGMEAWLTRVIDWFARLAAAVGEDEPLGDPAGDGPRYEVGREQVEIRRRRAELEELLLLYIAHRRECGAIAPDDPVLAVAYPFLRFARVLELDGDEFAYLFEPRPDGSAAYHIQCLDPSRQLAARLRGFHGVVAMSATLEPETYYRDLLGFPTERTSSVRYPSPFAATNRRILVVPTVSTTYRERDRWYGKVAETVDAVYAARAGHWVAFFPSFAYLREIELRLGPVAGELMIQQPSMRDGERAELLDRLAKPDGEPRLLLAVLGGVFAEGVDLPGDALVGVIVVSPGLPRVSVGRELLRRRFEERFELGFDYAYLVPGLSRVIQAAGRLVRTPTDRGVVVLLDRRFASAEYTRYFPRDWYDVSPSELVERDPARRVLEFFAAGGDKVGA